VHWPGVVEPGSTTEHVSRFFDIMPTLVDITGATYPDEYKGEPVVELQGRSLLPIFRGESARREGPIFWKWQDSRAVYRDGWKLVQHGDRGWELYDFEADRSETRNLAPQRPTLVNELDSAWTRWYDGTARYRNPETSQVDE
jgi:arylsulfatase